MHPIAVLAGSKAEFEQWVNHRHARRDSPPPECGYFHVSSEDRARGMIFSGMVIVGTWAERGNARTEELVRTRIRP